MSTQVELQKAIRMKKYGYLSVYLVPLLLPIAYWLGVQYEMLNFYAWAPIIFVFGIVPIVDHIVGKDAANPDEGEQVEYLSGEKFYRILTLLCFPAQLASLAFAGWVFVNADLNLLGSIGWIVSTGVVGGVLAINVGHELIHKDPKLESWTGGLLLATVYYGGFKVEHVRGHHVHVSTPEDASSSRYGQSVYAFLPHAYLHNFLNAWKLEKIALQKKGKSLFSLSNELFYWYGFSILLTALFFWAFGVAGLVFFLAQSFIAFTELEIINYIEHYGLHRRKLENGRYERTNPTHSWNSNFLITNMLLFQLQRHSDHHAYAKRRYQVLRHYDESPQLPGGYATMFVLALVPPLWFKVMNPRVEAYYKGELDQLAN